MLEPPRILSDFRLLQQRPLCSSCNIRVLCGRLEQRSCFGDSAVDSDWSLLAKLPQHPAYSLEIYTLTASPTLIALITPRSSTRSDHWIDAIKTPEEETSQENSISNRTSECHRVALYGLSHRLSSRSPHDHTTLYVTSPGLPNGQHFET